jgi:carbon monoxide dehydrogenase subunit G
MASVRVEIVIEAAAEHVWAAVADAGAVHRRLLPGRVAAARMEGDVRVLTMPGGAEVRELIVAVDQEARRMAYSVQGGQRMALAHHHASFQVFDEGGGRSRLVWITDVLPHDRAPEVRARCAVAIGEMKDVLEAAQPTSRVSGGRS